MKWECRESSFEKRVFETIDLTVGPVAIVLFGVDSELKRSVRKLCWQRIRGLMNGSSRERLMNLERAYRAIRMKRKVIVAMPETASVWKNYRREVVIALRRLGAIKVVGIFAKEALVVKNIELDEQIIKMNHFIKALEIDPPRTEEFDQLIIVENT